VRLWRLGNGPERWIFGENQDIGGSQKLREKFLCSPRRRTDEIGARRPALATTFTEALVAIGSKRKRCVAGFFMR